MANGKNNHVGSLKINTSFVPQPASVVCVIGSQPRLRGRAKVVARRPSPALLVGRSGSKGFCLRRSKILHLGLKFTVMAGQLGSHRWQSIGLVSPDAESKPLKQGSFFTAPE